MIRLFWICLAGAAGTAARYLVALWSVDRFGAVLPYGTLIVNLTGCFLIAFVMETAAARSWPETTRLAVTVGFLGGFTTYSSFNFEATRLAQTGVPSAASLYVLATLVGGLPPVFLARWRRASSSAGKATPARVLVPASPFAS